MSDKREKQLNIVLKLNKLTKQGKLTWSWSGPLVDITGAGYKYYATFKNRRFQLSDSPIFNAAKQLQHIKTLPNEGSKFSLSIQGDDKEKEIWIPPMPAVDDLASTVRYQLMKMEGDTKDLDEVLKDLEEAESLLEE